MVNKKEVRVDIRNIRTTTAIMEAFIEELQKRHFHDVTVNDICERAGISRGTFYRHYEDKYDLVRSLMKKFSREIDDQARRGDLQEKIRSTLECCDKYRQVLKNIHFGNPGLEMQNMLYSLYAKDIEQELAQDLRRNIPSDITAYFCAVGISYVEELWLCGKLRYSKDELSAYISTLAGSVGMRG